MRSFSYSGDIPSSKSQMNRALIVKSFFPEAEIIGASECDDVRHMQLAIQQLQMGNSSTFSVGCGGTTLRFLLARLSRISGRWRIEGSERLMSRPHSALLAALEKLKIKCKVGRDFIELQSDGWQVPDYLKVDTTHSSQFVSALCLSSWGLDTDFTINMEGERPSLSYLQMTIEFLQSLGMEIEYSDPTIRVSAGQRTLQNEIELEPDMSSIFSLACFAALLGDLRVFRFPLTSRQPDFRFVSMFKQMGIPIAVDSKGLSVAASKSFRGGEWDLSQSPDLFPVLAVLLTRASSPSRLTGLDTLQFKESDRLGKTIELLKAMNVRFQFDDHTLTINGGEVTADVAPLSFDPDEDHRMVMAATLCQHLGYPMTISNQDVVNKSFPEFFKIVGKN